MSVFRVQFSANYQKKVFQYILLWSLQKLFFASSKSSSLLPPSSAPIIIKSIYSSICNMIFAQVWPVLLKLWARNPLLEHLCGLWMFVKLTIHGKEIIVMQIKKKTRKILFFLTINSLNTFNNISCQRSDNL